MSSKNDITGDKIRTKGILSKQGEENFDAIFRKPKPTVVHSFEELKAAIEKLDKDAL